MKFKEINSEYKISEDGDVYFNNELIKNYVYDYKSVRIYSEKIKNLIGVKRGRLKGYVYIVHRLVYTFFVGEIPKNYIVHHKDGNKLNNNYKNLECISISEHGRLHNDKGKKSITNRREWQIEHRKILGKEVTKMYNDRYKERMREYYQENKEQIEIKRRKRIQLKKINKNNETN